MKTIPQPLPCLLLAALPLAADTPADANAALIQAIRRGQSDAVACLLRAGSNPDAPLEDGRTPIYLVSEGWGNPAPAILEHLARAGADFNHRDNEGKTALMSAEKEIVPLLLAAGADVNIRDNEGRTALMHQCRDSVCHGGPATLQAVLDKGADLHATDNYGNTALMHAAMGGDISDIAFLLQAGAKVDATNYKGRTPLMLAAMFGHWQAVVLLMDHGSDIHARDYQGRTVLMHAINSGRVTAILLAAGADPGATDSASDTALSLALKKGYKDIPKLLRAYGAKN